MAITISGSGITSANIADGTIVNADINSSAAIAGTKVDGSFGKVLQVVSVTKTDIFSTTANGVEVAITGLAATITPTSTTSKVLVEINVSHCSTGVTHKLRVKRGATLIGVGAAAGSRQQAGICMSLNSDTNQTYASSYSYLDSPSTTSATTYSTYTIADNGTQPININYSINDANTATGGRYVSTITLTEIGA